MSTLDPTQFNQLVQEVREALLVESQGVGEVEIVTSLTNLVSLPALRLIGATETVVEAPLELLSAPAVEAASDARKATDDAIIAAVNASAAADLSEAERNDLEEIKQRAIAAGTNASAQGDGAFRGAMGAENATFYAMQIASYLQTRLEQAQVVITSGKASQDVIESMNRQVQERILICAGTREEAYAAILQLRELQLQVAQAIVTAYVSSDQMQLSVAAAQQATALANKAAGHMCELSERAERVIVESVIQTGKGRQAVIRLEDLEKDLLFSKTSTDLATSLTLKQADRAEKTADEAERLNQDNLILRDQLSEFVPVLDKASEEAGFSASGADNAAGHATEEAESARLATELALQSKSEADIAAAAALVAEQRAIEAAKTAENIVADIRPDYNEADKTNSNYIANKPETPTLEAVPTADTLTYVNRDNNVVDFKVGDEVRVLEGGEYVFYKLYDVVDGAASWDEAGSGSRLKANIYLTGADYNSGKLIEQGILKQE